MPGPKTKLPEPRAEVTLPPPGAPLGDCYAYCEAVARAHHENFPVASLFLPGRLRPHVFALYAFARAADDYVDEPEFAGRRHDALGRWEDELRRTYHGQPRHPIFVALADTVDTFDIPIGILEDILRAFRMDLTDNRFTTWQDLMSYIGLAARPIGHALLYVYGYRDAERHRYGEELSTALALTNFWQDVATDLSRNRVYLPQEDLRYFGITEQELFARTQSDRLESLVRYLCARTRSHFERARPLIRAVRDDLGVEMALAWHGGRIALDRIEQSAPRFFEQRDRLSTADKARAVVLAMRDRGLGLARRL